MDDEMNNAGVETQTNSHKTASLFSSLLRRQKLLVCRGRLLIYKPLFCTFGPAREEQFVFALM